MLLLSLLYYYLLHLCPLLVLEQLEENCYSSSLGVGNIVRNDEQAKKETYEEFCGLSMLWFLKQSFTNMTQNDNRSKCLLLPHIPCSFSPKADNGWHAHNLAMRRPLQISWFSAQRSVWLVRTFVNFTTQRQSHCSQAGQLNDLWSKGYNTCAFLSTNQAHVMPSDSSNNPNGNLVLNSISDTTILLMQNSDRFGWQGRNACF